MRGPAGRRRGDPAGWQTRPDPRTGRFQAADRDRCYDQIRDRALAWSVVSIEAAECDRLGMHVANVEALRRALFRLDLRPAYVLTDGFGVDGLGVPGLAIWKGDRVAACIAAASVIAKVTRDRIMLHWHEVYPQYDFAVHKGYCTPEHQAALDEYGPCPQHRRRFENVRRSLRPDMGQNVTSPTGVESR